MPTVLLAAVMVAERIHNEIDRLGALVSAAAPAAMSVEVRGSLEQAAAHLDAMLERYLAHLGDLRGPGAGAGGASPPLQRPAMEAGSAGPPPAAALRTLLARLGEQSAGAAGDAGRPGALLIARLENLCDILEIHPAELPLPSLFPDSAQPSRLPSSAPLPDHGEGEDSATPQRPNLDPFSEPHTEPSVPLAFAPHRPRLNRFLLRYTARHTIAMGLAFVTGLFANNPALHAALWLIMIGGPPVTGRPCESSRCGRLAPRRRWDWQSWPQSWSVPALRTCSHIWFATFVGVLVMAYIGRAADCYPYLSIGGTAFVIAFSSLGPRDDPFGSIWTLAISFGMLIRAAVSMFWRERASRTLVEEFQDAAGIDP